MASQIPEWAKLAAEEVAKELSTDLKKGLSAEHAKRRLKRFGANVLERERGLGSVGKVLKQFKSPLVFILLIAGVVTFLLQAFIDATVIGIALLINVVVGVFQEERASRAFEKLSTSQERFATVVRGGAKRVIPAEELVPGDVVEIKSGSYVPADLRLYEERDLSINESVLTGEWAAVKKDRETVEGTRSLAEQKNMGWMGTLVVAGEGRGVVVATGSRTQVGLIAQQLGAIDESMTPLQHSIRRVARFIAYAIGLGIVAIFGLGMLRGVAVPDMLFMSIALAVAAIPSGLPAAVTATLALGMESILRRGGLVRNLLAAETLGATTIILTDKTGTLTEAKMRLSSIYTLQSLEREGRDAWTHDDRELLKGAVLASDAFVEEGAPEEGRPMGRLQVHGRPIERAIVLAGLDAGISQRELGEQCPRLDYLQFASERRFGAALTRVPGSEKRRLYVTGAPEFLLERSSYVEHDKEKELMTDSVREVFSLKQQRRSAEGMRFIGVAYKEVGWDTIPTKEETGELPELTDELVFLGFMSFEDPVRGDVAESILRVKGAGARVVMVTGDNPETARSVAQKVGIAEGPDEPVCLGKNLDNMSDGELREALLRVRVFARTLPNQKLRIVHVLKRGGAVVAMTGDGVNDAPALQSANIGVAVGSGTEVAKEASDLVLINNSFSIIVAAIEEGRKIIDNLKKIITYLLSTSFSGITVVASALAAGAPLPLLPTQLLWSNIIEEGLMSFSFAFEKAQPGLMKRSPAQHHAADIMTGGVKRLIVIAASVTSVFLIALYFVLLRLELPIEEIRTIMFVALALDAIFFSFSLKSFERPVWRINPWDNWYLLVALGVSIALLIAAITWPPLQLLLSIVPLSPWEFLLLAGVGVFNLVVIEAVKYLTFGRKGLA